MRNKLIKSFLLFLLFFKTDAQQSLESIYEQSAQLRHDRSDDVLQKMRDSDFEVTYRPILLREMIETGLRQNFDQTIREYQSSLLEISMDNAHDSFWYPRLKIDLSSGPHPIIDLSRWETQPSDPGGYLGIGFDNYTVFNWGKDYLTYLNSKTTYKRGKDSIIEDRRAFRHQMIIAFFNLWQIHEIEKIWQENLRQAAFIYKLNRQKVELKKVRIEEYHQARSEYLRAQQSYQQARINVEIADEEISNLLNNDIGTRYTLKETLAYLTLDDQFSELLQYALEKNSSILDAATELEISSRAYKIALKDNMPLPKFSLNLGGYSHVAGTGINSTKYSTGGTLGNNSLDLVAAVNATWTLWGVNGFLNRRLQQTAKVQKDIAEKRLQQSKVQTSSLTRQYYRKVLNYQDQIKILAASIENDSKLVDEALDSYMNGKAIFLDFKHALDNHTSSQINFVQNKFLHLKNKIMLAEEMGMDDMPGKNFEELALLEIEKEKDNL